MGVVDRRGDERHAPGLHAQPARLRPARVQPARHARREVSLHGQRPDDRADGGVGGDRPRLGLGRAALAGDSGHAARRAGPEDRDAEHAGRRQGAAAVGHPRQQPGLRLRASLADEEGRRRARRASTACRSARASIGGAAATSRSSAPRTRSSSGAQAAALLAAEGIDAEVIDLRTIKPIDEAIVLESLQQDRPARRRRHGVDEGRRLRRGRLPRRREGLRAI